jgi:hypothetical protein
MYSLKAQFDVERFVGKTLEQVCYAKHQSTLHFSGSLRIQLMDSNYCVFLNNKNEPLQSDEGINVAIVDALESDVLSVKLEGESNLTLFFSNGLIISIKANSQYENYFVFADGEQIIV